VIINKSILIKTSGFYLIDWDPETNVQIGQSRISETLTPYFGYFTEFEDGVTVKDLLEVIGDFSEEINLVFSGYLGGVDFDLFLQESLILSTGQPSIDYIEIAWKVRMISTPDMVVLDIIPNILGVTEIVGSDSDVVTELDFIKLRDLCKFTICEQTALDIPSPKTYQIAVEAERRWTLFDIISGFLSEISKYGSPEEKSQMIDELNKESKLSFSELLKYVDEIEQLSEEIETGNPEDLLGNDEDDD
jgi:hypothetical protein